MGSIIKILFFVIFFGVWIVKIAKKFSEMKNTQSQAAYGPQRRQEIPQPAEKFPELDFEKEQKTHQTSAEPVYEAEQDAVRGFLKQLNLAKEEVEEIPEEKFEKPVEEKVPEVALVNDSWKSEEVISALSIGASDARMGIIMSEILGKPIALK